MKHKVSYFNKIDMFNLVASAGLIIKGHVAEAVVMAAVLYVVATTWEVWKRYKANQFERTKST